MNPISRRNILLYGLGGLGATFGFSIEAANGAIRNRGCRCGVKAFRNYNKKFNRAPDKWGKNHLTYLMSGRDTNDMDAEVWDTQFKLAFESWSVVCPLTFSKVHSQDKADFVIGVSRRRRSSFGKRGGVLAWAEMPPRNDYDGQLRTMFDLAEDWVLPGADYGIILQAVAAHEIGHLLGLGHSRVKGTLMYPYINDALIPQASDIAEIQSLYGKKE